MIGDGLASLPTRLAAPGWLLLMPLVVVPWLAARADIPWADVGRGGVAKGRFGSSLRGNLPRILRSLAVSLAILSLSRPQRVLGMRVERSTGVAIVILLDRSASMSRPPAGADPQAATRLDEARRLLADFLESRPGDLIGLVAFANWPDTLCPPTLDHPFVSEALGAVSQATRLDDGTNLGDAIAWATRDALSVEAERRVVLLITDGRNEPDRSTVATPLDPQEASALARSLGVVIHAIGIAEPDASIPAVDLDEALLAEIADAAGGRFFVARGSKGLAPILETLDALEKAPIESITRTRYREFWPVLLGCAVAMLVIEWGYRQTSVAPLAH